VARDRQTLVTSPAPKLFLAVATALALSRSAVASADDDAVQPQAAAPAPADDPASKAIEFYSLPKYDLHIYPDLMAQVDFNAFAGSGVSRYQLADFSGLSTGVRLNSVRLGFRGRLLGHWYYQVLGELSQKSVPNTQERAPISASPLDVWVAYKAHEMLRLQVGEFRVPYGYEMSQLESLDFMDFSPMARMIPVRDLGVQISGATDRFFYAVAYVDGNGRGRAPVDNRGVVYSRVGLRLVAPQNYSTDTLVQIAGNVRYGSRDARTIGYDAAPMTTAAGYTFWNPVYRGVLSGLTHVIPAGLQRDASVDAVVNVDRVDLRAAGYWVKEGRREATDGLLDVTLRGGTLSGYAYEAELGLWVYGPPRPNGDFVGLLYKFGIPKPPVVTSSVQVVTRWTQAFLSYDSWDRSRGVPGIGPGLLDTETTNIRFNVFELAANYYIGRLLRFSAEYALYDFPGAQVGEGGPVENQAAAPGAVVPGTSGTRAPSVTNTSQATAQAATFPPPAPGARFLHEFTARAQIHF
jgi:hypothetical protein